MRSVSILVALAGPGLIIAACGDSSSVAPGNTVADLCSTYCSASTSLCTSTAPDCFSMCAGQVVGDAGSCTAAATPQSCIAAVGAATDCNGLQVTLATSQGCDLCPSTGAPDVVGGTDVIAGDTAADTAADTGSVDVTPPGCAADTECASTPETPLCDTDTGDCVALPLGHQIGWRDGSASSVTLTELYRPNNALESTDLEFHPTRDELWVVQRQFEVPGICAENNPGSARCRSFDGIVTIIFAPGKANQRVETKIDGNAWHFMRRPPALAMGALDTFATCGEASTGNYEDDPSQFIGPTLWSSDASKFAVTPFGGNGSHLDMLHATPWCMGIAWERDNVYWAFNGNVGSIDRYDFHEDHGPGNDDHSDGTIFRYATGQVFRVPGVPSHMQFNPADDQLYIADTGGARIVKLDTKSGNNGPPFQPVYEYLADWGLMNNAKLTDVVPGGLLNQPSGLALHDDLIFVSDHATSTLYAFDMSGTEVNRQVLDLPAGSLAGIELGPDDKLYLSDMLTGAVYRLDPQ